MHVLQRSPVTKDSNDSVKLIIDTCDPLSFWQLPPANRSSTGLFRVAKISRSCRAPSPAKPLGGVNNISSIRCAIVSDRIVTLQCCSAPPFGTIVDPRTIEFRILTAIINYTLSSSGFASLAVRFHRNNPRFGAPLRRRISSCPEGARQQK
jgi:hypothetical protein